MKKKLIILLAVTVMMMSLCSLNVSALKAPPTPTMPNVSIANVSASNVSANISAASLEGTWYVGATPPNYDPKKPVLVFVQGLHGNATNWWGPTVYYGNNDMYAYAYNAGYRTAFVNFRDADGNAGSMWLNGSVLSGQLQKICAYYGVKKVNIVAHSKGGIDTQSAIVHYGAYAYVDKVFTLSTPHWGSQTADLAYSSYASWLADLLGQQDDGTYVLQTSYMSYFRSITDNRSENNGIKYYTSAGTNWGPLFSSLWFGASYLSFYGSNDGLVTVANAQNPRATHVNTGDYNHDNIRMGSKSWWYIQPKIGTLSVASSQTFTVASAYPDQNTTTNVGNYLLRGGQINKTATTVVPVESGAASVSFDLMLADPNVSIDITAPDGTHFTPENTFKDSEFFSGATHFVTKVIQPKPGKWNIKIDSEKTNAYFLMTSFDSQLNLTLNSDKKWGKGGSPLNVNLTPGQETSKKLKTFNASANINKVMGHGKVNKVSDFQFNKKNAGFEKGIALPSEPGVYNYNVNIEGTMDDGTPFERTVVQSVVVESDSTDKAASLKSLLPDNK